MTDDDLAQDVGDYLVRMNCIKRGTDPHTVARRLASLMESKFAEMYADRLMDILRGHYAYNTHEHYDDD